MEQKSESVFIIGDPDQSIYGFRGSDFRYSIDEFSEAIFIAKEINRMVGGIDMLDAQALSGPGRKKPAASHTRSLSDIAVLYRTNRQAEILEQCLSKEGIQYVVVWRDEFLDNSLSGLRCTELLLNTAVMYDEMSSLYSKPCVGT